MTTNEVFLGEMGNNNTVENRNEEKTGDKNSKEFQEDVTKGADLKNT
jgi:hypothetical protein